MKSAARRGAAGKRLHEKDYREKCCMKRVA